MRSGGSFWGKYGRNGSEERGTGRGWKGEGVRQGEDGEGEGGKEGEIESCERETDRQKEKKKRKRERQADRPLHEDHILTSVLMAGRFTTPLRAY